ncbi:MAG TPA: 6-carboxytetrahydropterin synthase [bacterium]|nr:6-carboxytetrahydropterin synthase [bacterium]
MFEVTVRKDFEASHALRDYRGGAEEPHSHSFRCEAAILSQTLDSSGCAIDFAAVDEALSRALAPLAGASLEESPLFSNSSPSAENMALYIFKVLEEALNDSTRRVSKVVVWEDGGHSASYFE